MKHSKGVTRKESIRRDLECCRLCKTGKSYESIGIALGISRQAVHQRLKRPPYSKVGRKKASKIKKRHMKAIYLLLSGYSQKDVNSHFGMSMNWCNYIIKKYNLRKVYERNYSKDETLHLPPTSP